LSRLAALTAAQHDAYTVYARLFAAAIASAPAIALLWVIIASKGVRLVLEIADTTLATLLMVFADVARRGGKAIEPRLIDQMGGLPSVTMRLQLRLPSSVG
jgi:hypothetical protein